MKQNLFGKKANYENFTSSFVLIGLLNRFDNRYQSAAEVFFKELSWKQMYFLNCITMFGEAPSMQDIAGYHQHVNKLAAKLLKDEYIVSLQDENDHRKQRLSLTDKTKNFLNRNKTEAYKCVSDIFSVVSETELETVISVMAKLTERIEVLHGGKK